MKVEKMYNKIPQVKGCRKGCSDCCGPVLCSSREFEKIPDIPEKLAPVCDERGERLLVCRFSSEKGCLVYDYRPLICRLFGAVNYKLLTCPHGAKAERPMSEPAARKMINKMIRKGHVFL